MKIRKEKTKKGNRANVKKKRKAGKKFRRKKIRKGEI